MGLGRKDNSMMRSQEAEKWQIRCICGATELDDDSESLIACDKCDTWQHTTCMGLRPCGEKSPGNYMCEECSPENHKDLLRASSEGRRLWEERRKAHKEDSTRGEKRKRRKKQHISSSAEDEVQDSGPTIATFPLTEDCHHYTRRVEVPWDNQK